METAEGNPCPAWPWLKMRAFQLRQNGGPQPRAMPAARETWRECLDRRPRPPCRISGAIGDRREPPCRCARINSDRPAPRPTASELMSSGCRCRTLGALIRRPGFLCTTEWRLFLRHSSAAQANHFVHPLPHSFASAGFDSATQVVYSRSRAWWPLSVRVSSYTGIHRLPSLRRDPVARAWTELSLSWRCRQCPTPRCARHASVAVVTADTRDRNRGYEVRARGGVIGSS
jgi:hypothetical protein